MRQWCKTGTTLLDSQDISQCETKEKAQGYIKALESCLAEASDLQLSDPREFRNMFEDILTSRLKVSVLLLYNFMWPHVVWMIWPLTLVLITLHEIWGIWWEALRNVLWCRCPMISLMYVRWETASLICACGWDILRHILNRIGMRGGAGGRWTQEGVTGRKATTHSNSYKMQETVISWKVGHDSWRSNWSGWFVISSQRIVK